MKNRSKVIRSRFLCDYIGMTLREGQQLLFSNARCSISNPFLKLNRIPTIKLSVLFDVAIRAPGPYDEIQMQQGIGSKSARRLMLRQARRAWAVIGGLT